MALPDSYLTKTLSASNRKTWTYSTWIKSTQPRRADTQTLFGTGYTGNSSFMYLYLTSDQEIGINGYISSVLSINLKTTRKLVDTTSWYHLVFRCDTTQSTEADRFRIYINGVEETNLATSTYPSQDSDQGISANVAHCIGEFTGLARKFGGYMAHTHFADGQSYAPTVFGESDSTTGEWKPILNPSVTYGTNGFFLKFENSAALGTDSSGQSNTWTVNGNLKQSISTPSNTFATLDEWSHFANHKVGFGGTGLLSYANATVGMPCFPMVSTGKWYVEFKSETDNTLSYSYMLGIVMNGRNATFYGQVYTGGSANWGKDSAGNGTGGIAYKPNISTPVITSNNSDTNYGTQASANDIIMMAFELNGDSSKIWFGRNGTWFNAPGTSNVGDPANGNNPGLTFSQRDEFWGIMMSSSDNQANNSTKETYVNFGEGRFGTTAVASANADGAGMGAFEYAVPSGFYAICTKNIKNYG
tara:strand:+ start:1447 stop:2865 length:1419 start_codon:yes stop_codon:yes gene_type:complete